MKTPPKSEPKLFKSPKPHPVFTREWNRLINFVATKTGFHNGHLSMLEILCDLYAEYENLTSALAITGYTYTTDGGRNGKQIRHYPEVAQLNKTRTDIATYCKLLGIFITDKSGPIGGSGGKNPEDKWE